MRILHYFKQNKRFIGLLLSVVYSFIIRVLAEHKMMDVNSIAFMYITPGVLSFIPFFFKDEKFLNSIWRWIYFPLMSILLFLSIAVVERLEDLICFLIIGFPYILISIVISLIIGSLLRTKNDGLTQNSIPILLFPVMFGFIEKSFPKEKQSLSIKNEIIINKSKSNIFSYLVAVPKLKTTNSSSVLSYFGLPRPTHSTYDSITNVRLGYFENGVVLHETVAGFKQNESVVFHIDIEKSKLSNSPTLRHLLETKNIDFKDISYRVVGIDKNQTTLELSTNFTIHSNLSQYGRFWSQWVINDFEVNLLKSLKRTIES